MNENRHVRKGLTIYVTSGTTSGFVSYFSEVQSNSKKKSTLNLKNHQRSCLSPQEWQRGMRMLIGATHPCVFSEIRTGPWQAPTFPAPLCGGQGTSLIPLRALHPQLSVPCGALLSGLLLRASWFESISVRASWFISRPAFMHNKQKMQISADSVTETFFSPGMWDLCALTPVRAGTVLPPSRCQLWNKQLQNQLGSKSYQKGQESVCWLCEQLNHTGGALGRTRAATASPYTESK